MNRLTKSLIFAITIFIFAVAVLCFSCFAESGYYCSDNVFSDLDSNAYYFDAVLYCYNYGYLSGTGNGKFSPGMDVTRAQIVTTLYSINDKNEKYSVSDFSDVAIGKWYFNPIEWAYESKITSGTSSTAFSPDKILTREEFAVFLMKFASYNDIDTQSQADLSEYSDAKNISSWALKAIKWCIETGIMTPTSSSTVSPKMITDRAEMASCLKRFCRKYIHNWEISNVIQERTCIQDGVIEYKCSDCEKTRTVTLKAWHKWDSGKNLDSSSDGCVMEFTCLVCSEKSKGTVPHSWDDGICLGSSSSGCRMIYTCSVCGGFYTKTVSHKWDGGKCIEAVVNKTVTEYTCNVCGGKYQDKKVKKVNAGDCVLFGKYEQDNNHLDGREWIEWIVLDKEGDKILVISRYILDSRKYNNGPDETSWESCSLRNWLNNDFLNGSFNSDERKLINTTKVINECKFEGVDPGNTTYDKVFLLSGKELNRYFAKSSNLLCQLTKYASARCTNVYNGSCSWWLRDLGFDSRLALIASFDPSEAGESACLPDFGMRPAMWISLVS